MNAEQNTRRLIKFTISMYRQNGELLITEEVRRPIDPLLSDYEDVYHRYMGDLNHLLDPQIYYENGEVKSKNGYKFVVK